MASAAITLAIPYHLDLDYLCEAVESVRAQSDPDWQLLVVDDACGRDDVAARIGASDDPRIEVLVNERNLGMVANWNRCIDAAQTDLVTLLHADDRLLPGYVAHMRTLADANPDATAVFCATEIIDDEGAPRFSFPDFVKSLLVPRGSDPFRMEGEAALRALMRGDFIMCPTLCYRKALLGARRFESGWKQVQDLELLARLLLDGAILLGSRSAHYAYRRHAASATSVQSENLLRFEEEHRLFARIADQAEACGWSRAARVARRGWILRLHLAFRIATDLAGLRFSAAVRKLRFALAPIDRSP